MEIFFILNQDPNDPPEPPDDIGGSEERGL